MISKFSGAASAALALLTVPATAQTEPPPNAFQLISVAGKVTIGGNGLIAGTNGVDDVSLLYGAVNLDGSFNRGGDIVRLSGNAGNYFIARSGSSSAIVTDNAGLRLTIPLGTVGLTLAFDDGPRKLVFEGGAYKIGTQIFDTGSTPIIAPAQGSAPPTTGIGGVLDILLMSGVPLQSGQQAHVTVGGKVQIAGSNAVDVVTIADSGGEFVFDGSFNRGGDILVLNGNAANYTATRQGSSTMVIATAGRQLTIPIGQAGLTLRFADGDRNLVFSNGKYLVGDQEIVGSAPTPLNPVPSGPPTANSSLLNLTISEDFTNDAATASASYPTNGSPPTTSTAQTPATVRYNAGTQGYTIVVGGRSQTFLPSNIDVAQSSPALTAYVKTSGSTTDSLSITKPGTSGRFTYQYVAGGIWQRTINGSSTISGSVDAFAYGIRTPDAAVPRTGSANYAVDLLGFQTTGSNVFAIVGEGQTQIDFQSGTVLTHGTTGDAISTTAPFSSIAQLSGSANSFTGDFRINGFNAFVGTINGRLYGPAGQELGASFSASGGGQVSVGTIIGRGVAQTATNVTVTNKTVNEFFTNDAATMTTTLMGSSGTNNGSEQFSGGSAAAQAMVVNYDAGSHAYTLITPTRSQYLLNNNSGDLVSTTRSVDLAGFPYAPLGNLRYTESRRWRGTLAGAPLSSTRYIFDEFVSGVETPDAALPRTGTAGFAIGLTGTAADSAFPNLAKIAGFGFLVANFSTSSLTMTGQMLFTEDYFIAGRRAAELSGNFSGSAAIASNANRFAGTISFDGLGAYSGTLNGRFYGPAAEEVGAAFFATDGAGGVAAGTFVGGRDPAATASTSGIAALTAPTSFAFMDGMANPGGPNLGEVTGVSYDPTAGSYAITIADTHLFGAPVSTVTLAAANRDAAASNSSFDAYSGTVAGQPYTARLLRPLPTNPTLALTYTSLAALIATPPNTPQLNDPRRDRHYIAFGLPTTNQQMPVGGTATYNGIALGVGKVTTNAFGGGISETNFYDLNGTATLTADFASASFNSTLSLTGVNIGSPGTRTFAPMTFQGDIQGNRLSTHLNGRTLSGQFFGPQANEFGALFDWFQTDGAGTLSELSGGVVGKR